MVYTVTFNPALDYVVGVKDFQPGGLNRTAYETIQFGGKGINVSTVLHNLGIENTALGFLAGFTGRGLGEGVGAAGRRVVRKRVRASSPARQSRRPDMEPPFQGAYRFLSASTPARSRSLVLTP